MALREDAPTTRPRDAIRSALARTPGVELARPGPDGDPPRTFRPRYTARASRGGQGEWECARPEDQFQVQVATRDVDAAGLESCVAELVGHFRRGVASLGFPADRLARFPIVEHGPTACVAADIDGLPARVLLSWSPQWGAYVLSLDTALLSEAP